LHENLGEEKEVGAEKAARTYSSHALEAPGVRLRRSDYASPPGFRMQFRVVLRLKRKEVEQAKSQNRGREMLHSKG